jgi:hypothetical protein
MIVTEKHRGSDGTKQERQVQISGARRWESVEEEIVLHCQQHNNVREVFVPSTTGMMYIGDANESAGSG